MMISSLRVIRSGRYTKMVRLNCHLVSLRTMQVSYWQDWAIPCNCRVNLATIPIMDAARSITMRIVKTAQFIELHKSTVKDQFVSWPNPQNMSNNEDVRWTSLTNKDGQGAIFIAKRTSSDIRFGIQRTGIDICTAPLSVTEELRCAFAFGCCGHWSWR
jgi:hypothetical protein